jgi:predicted ATPase
MSDAQGRFVVITGGPGSGKSTLIDALERAGHRTSPEVGREIIQAQMAIGGRALPWIDPLLFAEMMLSWEMKSHHQEAARPGTVFFDRGVPDVIGYLRLVGLPVPAHMMRAADLFRYDRPRLHCTALARDLRARPRAQADAGGGGADLRRDGRNLC